MTDTEIAEVVPATGSVVGGVVFLHWFDPEAPDGNNTQFRAEAEELAAVGVASVLPQLVFPWSVEPSGSAADMEQIESEVRGLKPAVDRLAALGAHRVVLVGHDFGAMHGVLLMARDRRIVAGVLIGPANRWADWFVRFWTIDEDRLDYMRAVRRLDPIEVIPALAPRPLLLQFAEHDWFIAGMDASELHRAAQEPKRTETYDADHAMRSDRARADRRGFILGALGIG